MDTKRDAIVDAIIGDIEVVKHLTYVDMDEIVDAVANMTAEEIEAMEEEFNSLPDTELSEEEKKMVEEMGQYTVYYFGMKIAGFSPIDLYEWKNMNPKPITPRPMRGG